jgi:hypothetical protein
MRNERVIMNTEVGGMWDEVIRAYIKVSFGTFL